MSAYRPIETAPKDGTRLLLHCDGRIAYGCWAQRFGRWWDLINGVRIDPTQWCPIPLPSDTSFEVERLREEVERLRAALTPRPIETAPEEIKDGRRLMLYWGEKSYESAEGCWDSQEDLWWSHVVGDYVSPTHYLEIPSLPAALSSVKEDTQDA